MTITERVRDMKILAIVVISVMLSFIIGARVKEVWFDYPEQFVYARNYQFRMELTNGDLNAIELYKVRYIANDRYLYNGPLTIRLYCEKYGYDITRITKAFESSGYETFQEFVDSGK